MKRVSFPQRIRRGSVTVTVYRSHKGGKDRFNLAYYDAQGLRQRPWFTDYTSAKREAEDIAEKLRKGDPNVETMHERDRVIYRRALEFLRPTGLALDMAAHQVAEAVKLLNGATLVEAAKFFPQHHQDKIMRKPVDEVVAELLAAKAAKGRSAVYTKDLRLRLERLLRTPHY